MTDPTRVEEALAQVEELLAGYKRRGHGHYAEARYLEGWAGTVKTLEYFHGSLHGGTSSLGCKDALGCPAKRAVEKFCNIVLGDE